MALEIDWGEWRRREKPAGISGCFRLRNEGEFMERAILSHLGLLDEAVLAIQPSDDDTYEIAYRLQALHPDKIRVYEYPMVVDWIDTEGFYAKDPEQPGHLVHLSNWALSKCRFSWICKVEGDVIATSHFAAVVGAVNAAGGNLHYFGRTILNVAGAGCDMVSASVPRNGGWDEAVFTNNPDYYRFHRLGRWESVPYAGTPHSQTGFSALHMKRCKQGNIGWNNERYVPFTKADVRAALEAAGGFDSRGFDSLFEKEWINYDR